MVPVFLAPDRDRMIVIFGGGPVALRKARQFTGFRLRVVAAEIDPELQKLADETVTEHFDPADLNPFLKEAFIAVAATNSKELNTAIAFAAKKAGVLVNSAHGGGDVLLPSVVRKDKYTVAVSSEGRAAAFPPFVAAQINGFLDEDYDRMLDLIIALRQEIRTRIATQPERAAFLDMVLHNDDVWNLLRSGNLDGAHALALKLHISEN